ncbi:MAG: TlpA family protein disulfide reductase [Planctomycetia bacterium]
MSSSNRFGLHRLPVVLAGIVCGMASVGISPAVAQPGAVAEPAADVLKVPPLPKGTPAELMQFVEGLRAADVKPKSRPEMMQYMKDVSTVTIEAANSILSKVKQTDPLHGRAAMMKLESLMMLGRLGDEAAAKEMATFATSLVNSPNAELAREAQRLVLVSDAQKLFANGSAAGGEALVQKTAAMLAADPDDMKTAGLAMQLAQAFEQLPDGEPVAVAAYKAFGPLFASSGNERIKQMGESFAGTLRRLSLPGNSMEIKGTLLNGKPFDQKTLVGKVVLVDFWATWCGPCVAEIPNVMEQYEKYHDKGFEVVGISLDEDRESLQKFVEDRKVPWPILFEQSEGSGWQHPMATYYGISGIPTVILIGRDGKVITLNARGEKLGEELSKLFSNAG